MPALRAKRKSLAGSEAQYRPERVYRNDEGPVKENAGYSLRVVGAGATEGCGRRLKRRKAQGSQTTIQQPLIDINVERQQLTKDAPKIGQIAP